MVDKKQNSVQVEEVYRNFEPSYKVKETIERLLSGVSDRYLIGLHSIVLTNASGLNRKRRREKTISRKKRIFSRRSLGIYHQAWQGEPAYMGSGVGPRQLIDMEQIIAYLDL